MANKLYVLGLYTLLDTYAAPRVTDIRACSMKAALVRGYTFNQNHHYLSEVTSSGGTIVARTPASIDVWTSTAYDNPGPPYANASLLFGVDLVNFAAVPAGAACNSIIFYFAGAAYGGADYGGDSAMPLFSYVDTATGLPYTPNGSAVTVSFGSGYYLGGIRV